MTITELRYYTGMNRAEFSRFFHIPYRTLQCWEKRDEDPKDINARRCPPYVLYLLEMIIVHNSEPDAETNPKKKKQCEGDIHTKGK